MKRLIFLVLLITAACTEPNPWTGKIHDWQERQKDCEAAPVSVNWTGDIYTDLAAILDTLPAITYIADGLHKDYWQTSCQTLTRLKGDCEDAAILAYMTILQSGLDGPDSPYEDNADVRIRIYSKQYWDDEAGEYKWWTHAVCIVEYQGRLYEISNMWLTDDPYDGYDQIDVEFGLWSIYYLG